MKLKNRPVGIHAFRIASLFFLWPNVVIIPITAISFFLERLPFFDKRFGIKPSCLAAAIFISRTDNFFCCSLENRKASLWAWNYRLFWIWPHHVTTKNIKLPAGYNFQCILNWYGRLTLKVDNKLSSQYLLLITTKPNIQGNFVCFISWIFE